MGKCKVTNKVNLRDTTINWGAPYEFELGEMVSVPFSSNKSGRVIGYQRTMGDNDMFLVEYVNTYGVLTEHYIYGGALARP